jgi:membrane protein implicated in regulation of membrane protease activity
LSEWEAAVLSVTITPMPRHAAHKAVQWVGSVLAALIYGVMMLIVFRPSLLWSAIIFALAVVGFTFAFHWLFVERPGELRKKLGESEEERRAASREITPHTHWPPK